MPTLAPSTRHQPNHPTDHQRRVVQRIRRLRSRYVSHPPSSTAVSMQTV
jgi:hypothetical protein